MELEVPRPPMRAPCGCSCGLLACNFFASTPAFSCLHGLVLRVHTPRPAHGPRTSPFASERSERLVKGCRFEKTEKPDMGRCTRKDSRKCCLAVACSWRGLAFLGGGVSGTLRLRARSACRRRGGGGRCRADCTHLRVADSWGFS